VKALEFAGLPDVYSNARKLGLTTLQDVEAYGPAFTLGGADVTLMDLTYVFSVFANYGEQAGMDSVLDLPKGSRPLDPIVILKVQDSTGRTLWQAKQKKERVIAAPYAYMVTHVLSDDSARSSMFGLNSPLKLQGREAAVKSGLTDNARDAWTIGYTPDLVTGVWVGNANNSPMRGATSTYTAAPIWNAFMQQALAGKAPKEFGVPSGIKFVQVCQSTGLLPHRGCSKVVTEVFAADNVPTGAGTGSRVQSSQPTATPPPRTAPTQPPKPTATPRIQDARDSPGNDDGGNDGNRGRGRGGGGGGRDNDD
jgi:membrane peptidoglycan carboxypeptidase